MKYLIAQIYCFFYMWTRGMWRHEQQLVVYALNGKTVVIAAMRVSRHSGLSTVMRIFYNPHGRSPEGIEGFFDQQGTP